MAGRGGDGWDEEELIMVKKLSVAALLLLISCTALAQKPNVLIFFVDDMGYGELGCYGSEDLRTPQIDSLAWNGVRCTAGYVSAPQCSPSRAGLLSGNYQQRFGHEANPERGFRATFGLDRSIRTIGDYLQAAGYRTAAIGKWDLGRAAADNPVNRGFDFYYGFLTGARHYRPSNTGPAHLRTVRGPNAFVTETRYITYQLTDGALEFLETRDPKPFFLYVAYSAPHQPFEAPEEAIARNGHIEDEKRRNYAGMITALDDSVGRVLAKLRTLGLEQNTLIFFLSDNGAPLHPGFTDGNNRPLRGQKGDLFEGGIRVPFIVQWTGAPLPSGTTYDCPVSALDLLPTALAAAGAERPPCLPGENILPYLEGKKPGEQPSDALYWRWMGKRAVRAGDWKWVSDPLRNVIGLFDLSSDPSERHNLIMVYPDRAAELASLWKTWNRDNEAPLWHPKQLEALSEQYGGEGMGSGQDAMARHPSIPRKTVNLPSYFPIFPRSWNR